MIDLKIFKDVLLLRCAPNPYSITLLAKFKQLFVRPNYLGPLLDCPMPELVGKGQLPFKIQCAQVRSSVFVDEPVQALTVFVVWDFWSTRLRLGCTGSTF
ncbi:hypothetical protein O181_043987 [Austropuccinia psidii MF-1]|uniref:Uncharacterized protein n=1 Tax=Austropuccinia psidii MF-1 TaxID=1389203 RepID=A0A9Q3DQX9_9BASI|nr:hypothetical protein [Austropuccinia psidii MF-1]